MLIKSLIIGLIIGGISALILYYLPGVNDAVPSQYISTIIAAITGGAIAFTYQILRNKDNDGGP
ncbi:MAG: hypothetical protein HKN36_12390 [Hellea sp.]|nr:hypothetical protein [Hellea sp.]